MNRIFIIAVAFVLLQCKNNTVKTSDKVAVNEVEYAKGFSIQHYNGVTKLALYRAFIGDNSTSVFYLIPRNLPIPDSLSGQKIIRTPVDKIVVTATSHIPMLEAIHAENSLVGFPQTSYISSPKTVHRIENGSVTELGNEQAMNVELLLRLQPDAVVGFAVDHPSKMYEGIERMGIPVLMNADWLEETPLGRAEWIKFFGALYNKSEEADSLFQTIAQNYLSLKEKAQKSASQPSVLSGSMFQNVWYTPAGESFLAQMLEDAHARYLWADTEGNGSLSLSFESVLLKAKSADYWIAPGDFLHPSDFTDLQPLYGQFEALAKGNTYTYAHLKNKNGGFLYLEVAPLHPDWVLEDFTQILHPELSESKPLHFFKRVE